MKKNIETGDRFTTPIGRVIFASIGIPSCPKGMEGANRSYSVGLELDANEPRVSELLIELEEFGKEKFGAKYAGVKKPFQTAAERTAARASKELREIDFGSTVLLTASTAEIDRLGKAKLPPRIFYADKTEVKLLASMPDDARERLLVQEAFYPGCYARIAVTPAAYNVGAIAGVKLFLNAVQFARHGDRIGGDLGDMFDVLESSDDDLHL